MITIIAFSSKKDLLYQYIIPGAASQLATKCNLAVLPILLVTLFHCSNVCHHGGPRLYPREEAFNLHILVGGVVGLVGVGVGNEKDRDAECFGEDVVGEAASHGGDEEG
jgi:hypothetical protein